MSFTIGIDVGGTFTDFLLAEAGGDPRIFKVLSTPEDPSIGVVEGIEEMARALGLSVADFVAQVPTIVHGTTVTTNATLTRNGARTGLLTTEGVRDALEMRRGIREEQYNNRYRNVEPLVPRQLRHGVAGRLDRGGAELAPLSLANVEAAIEDFQAQGIEAVAICFMNAFANPAHEDAAAALVRERLPDAYLSVSSTLLPSIRFYERVSSTVLNAYIGPKLNGYLASLTGRLSEIGFGGVLLIMQSNGGVVAPGVARDRAAVTLLSGPAAGPGAGLIYSRVHGREDCITADMGGTSFDAALVRDGAAVLATEGSIARHRIALPMLDIHTIGSGGGSIGWIDEGGLLRMGPQSAGADPGPACYGRGGELPACTDANLVLGYLDPGFFAGGRIALDGDAARKAIETQIGGPMGMTAEQAAAGMYRVINTNMAQGVREITIKKGFDPREFPMIVAGGAGPLHACMIGQELEMPLLLVPRESSILCAAGMLMSDLKHDFVRTFVSRLDQIDWDRMVGTFEAMRDEGAAMLESERIGEERRRYDAYFDCRYIGQYHEVSFSQPYEVVAKRDQATIADAFHAEHNRLYGYSLEEQGTPIEVINVRLQAIGETDKPSFVAEEKVDADASAARKGERRMYVPESNDFQTVPVYDGHAMRYGHRLQGPVLIEQVNTAILVSASFDCVCDSLGTFAIYQRGREDLVANAL
jgi:N-methylhydantoinase A